MKVLVTGPESDMLEICIALLRGFGIDAEAVQDVDASNISAEICTVLCDAVHPSDFSAFTFARAVKERRPDIRILLMTAYPDMAEVARISRYVDAVIEKPFFAGALRDLVQCPGHSR